jgi:pimeloyl-ACP methyl ester carboxylesterase
MLWAAIAPAQPSQPPPVVTPLETNEEIVSVETRPGVSVRMVLVKPEGEPKGIFLLYPGGTGRLIVPGGRIIRASFGRSSARYFPLYGFLAAVVDLPSDEARGLDDVQRLEDQRIEEAKKLVDFLLHRWDRPLFAVGHSSGTLSAALLAVRLGDPRLRGIVLAGSKSVASGSGPRSRELHILPLDRIKLPVLIVHHENDGCKWTSFEGAERLPKRFSSSPRVDFLAVRGGPAPMSADPCEGRWTPHDLFGQEAEVVAAVIAWAAGAPIPERIGP